jgi:hypothetical protein
MTIHLPIDTSAISFIDVMTAEPVLDRQTKQQKADVNGEPPYWTELVCIGQEGGKFPGTPPAGIRQGMPVTVRGPMVTDWAIVDRFGVTFRAAKVEPLSDAEAGRQAQQWCATGLDR